MMRFLFSVLIFLVNLFSFSVFASNFHPYEDESLVNSPMPGRILAIMATPGAYVHRGDVLIILEAMKMQMTLRAGRDGTIENICYKKGDDVSLNGLLLRFRSLVRHKSANNKSSEASLPSPFTLANIQLLPARDLSKDGILPTPSETSPDQFKNLPQPSQVSAPKFREEDPSKESDLIKNTDSSSIPNWLERKELVLFAFLGGGNPPKGPTTTHDKNDPTVENSLDEVSEKIPHPKGFATHKILPLPQEILEESIVRGFARYVYVTLFHPEVGFLISLIVMLFSVPSFVQSLSPSFAKPSLVFLRAATLKV